MVGLGEFSSTGRRIPGPPVGISERAKNELLRIIARFYGDVRVPPEVRAELREQLRVLDQRIEAGEFDEPGTPSALPDIPREPGAKRDL